MLFNPLQIRDIVFRNRIGVSPMCMYSAEDGMPNTWHMVHLGSRAVGGAASVIAEATAVVPEGRISDGDTGIWNDDQAAAWAPIAAFVAEQGAVPGIQLAHAGRKAGYSVQWRGGGPGQDPSWDIVGPSAVPFSEASLTPREMTLGDIKMVVDAFRDAAVRALEAGFQVVEIHGAHGYLIHEFLSPISNKREDAYGGSLENRTRLMRDVAFAIRAVWPERLPLFARISGTDWVEGGWDVEQSVELARMLKGLGVDLIDVSSGGNVASAEIPLGPGYQVHLAARVREGADILTAAVGLITDAQHADTVLQQGEADMIFLAREFLRDPYWPRRAAEQLGVEIESPPQYRRGWQK